MPEDFIEKLQTAVQTLDEAIRKQTDSEATRVEATAAIHDARNEALAAVLVKTETGRGFCCIRCRLLRICQAYT